MNKKEKSGLKIVAIGGLVLLATLTPIGTSLLCAIFPPIVVVLMAFAGVGLICLGMNQANLLDEI